jgi:hypothetical protein
MKIIGKIGFNRAVQSRDTSSTIYLFKNYDYSQVGAYFITICTKQKQCIIFGEIKNGKMRFNALGSIADKYWQEIRQHFPNVALNIYTIMPNHLHGILWIIKSSQCNNKNRKFGDDEYQTDILLDLLF